VHRGRLRDELIAVKSFWKRLRLPSKDTKTAWAPPPTAPIKDPLCLDWGDIYQRSFRFTLSVKPHLAIWTLIWDRDFFYRFITSFRIKRGSSGASMAPTSSTYFLTILFSSIRLDRNLGRRSGGTKNPTGLEHPFTASNSCLEKTNLLL
jgi:hypothetical protein